MEMRHMLVAPAVAQTGCMEELLIRSINELKSYSENLVPS